MAAAAFWYGKALMNALGGETASETMSIDWLSDTIKVALTTSAYATAQDTDEWYSNITNELPTSSGYTVGGETLTNKTIGYTAGTNTIKLDADDVTWGTSSITARVAVVYASKTSSDTSPLLGYTIFSANETSSAGNFTITWNASGIFTIVAS